MDKQKSCYIFRNAFIFMESGKLSDDLYRVLKDEISYMLDAKYILYMDKIYDTIDIDEGKFYAYIASVIKKVNIPLADSSVVDLDDYISAFNGMVKSTELSATLLILRLLQSEISRLVYHILSSNSEQGITKKYGIFAYINSYFEGDNAMYDSVEQFLNKCYDIVFDNAKLNYGGFSYGKKY